MVKNILVIKHGSFGDIIQINGCLRDIREHYSKYKIYILTTPAFNNYFSKCPFVDEVILDKRKSRWNFIYLYRLKQLFTQYKFERVFDLQNSHRTEFYRKYLSSSEWISSRTILRLNETKEDFDKKSILERFKIQLSRSKIDTKFSEKPQVSWMVDEDFQISSEIKKNYIVLFPFCSPKHHKKIWPYYSDLILKLKSKFSDIDIVIAPGPGEINAARNYNAKICLHNNQPTNFFQLAKLLIGAKYVISNDTGPAHLAAHLGCRGLALFGNHISPKKVSIETGQFLSITSKNIGDISVETVLKKIDSNL